MKLKTLLTTALIVISGSTFAHSWIYDSVALGAGYANDIFYGISKGTSTLRTGNDWDLGFQIPAVAGRDDNFHASVRASHVKKQVQIFLLRDSASYKWSTITPADTIGKTD